MKRRGVYCVNATFNNISVISWLSVLFIERNRSIRKKPPTCLKSLTSLFTYCCMAVHLAMSGIHTRNFSVIATDCIGSCESNYHAIATTTAPKMNQQKDM